MANLLKRLVFIVFTPLISTAYAVPNIWDVDIDRGFEHYSLSNSKNQGLSFSCNQAGGEHEEHSVYFQPNIHSDKYHNLSKGSYSLLINDETAISSIPESTNHRMGAMDWFDFTTAMESSRNIKLYKNNKLIATFTPKNTSKELDGLSEYCKPLFYKEF